MTARRVRIPTAAVPCALPNKFMAGGVESRHASGGAAERMHTSLRIPQAGVAPCPAT